VDFSSAAQQPYRPRQRYQAMNPGSRLSVISSRDVASKPHDIRIGVQGGQVVNTGHGPLAERQPSGLQEHTLRRPFHHQDS
jgi:hypothetical protein